MTNWKELARKHEDSANHYARRCYDLEAENERLSADVGRVIIAIDKGLTDKPSLEKIKRHLMCTLIDIGFVDATKKGA